MENKKLSSISLLNIRLLGLVSFINELDRARYNDAFILAKKMEKDQIKDAFVECWKANVPDGIECKLDSEEYYNNTYGKINV